MAEEVKRDPRLKVAFPGALAFSFWITSTSGMPSLLA